MTKRHEKEKLLQFLFGLDTVMFGTIRSSNLSENPLPNVNQACSKVIQEKQLKNMAKGEEEHSTTGGAVFTARATVWINRHRFAVTATKEVMRTNIASKS